MMDKDVIAAIIDTVRLLAFIVLAIAFNKLWIVLLAPLFMLKIAKED